MFHKWNRALWTVYWTHCAWHNHCNNVRSTFFYPFSDCNRSLHFLPFACIDLCVCTYRTIKLSSPKLSNITAFGCILVYAAVILLGLDHSVLPANGKAFPVVCTVSSLFVFFSFSMELIKCKKNICSVVTLMMILLLLLLFVGDFLVCMHIPFLVCLFCLICYSLAIPFCSRSSFSFFVLSLHSFCLQHRLTHRKMIRWY